MSNFLGTNVPTLLSRVAHALDMEMAARLRREGVSLVEFRVLMALRDAHPHGQRVTVLARRCLLQQPTASKLLDRMERYGLVDRKHGGTDRRVVTVVATGHGLAMAERLAALACEEERRARVALPALDFDGLRAVCAAYLGEKV